MYRTHEQETRSRSSLTHRYATSATINAYSALIHNYFGQETAPFPAVHLTVDTELTASGQGLGVKGYSSLPLGAGASPKPENCVFLPVPVSVKFAPSERAGCESFWPIAVPCLGEGSGWGQASTCMGRKLWVLWQDRTGCRSRQT